MSLWWRQTATCSSSLTSHQFLFLQPDRSKEACPKLFTDENSNAQSKLKHWPMKTLCSDNHTTSILITVLATQYKTVFTSQTSLCCTIPTVDLHCSVLYPITECTRYYDLLTITGGEIYWSCAVHHKILCVIKVTDHIMKNSQGRQWTNLKSGCYDVYLF